MRKTRPWSQFCGDKCRKAYHRNIRVSGIAPDIRATLTRIESALRSLVDVNNENRALDLARRVEALEKRP